MSTFRAGPLVNIPKLLLELGCDPDPVFEKADFERNALENIEHRISYLAGDRLLAECVTATKCEHFGLLLGEKADPSHLGLVGFLLGAASTVGQALETLVKNIDLHDTGGTCELREEGNFCQLIFHVHQPGVSAIAQIHDMSAVIMCKIMRSLCGKQWNASQVLLMRRKPVDLTPYTHCFRAPIHFNSDACSILFPSHCLHLTPPSADEMLYHQLEQEAGVLHEMQHHELLEMLPSILQRGVLLKRFSALDIADIFDIQERTLHRRLHSAGTSFRQELDSVREALSLQLLESSSLPICDIATSMGYASSSGFIRAFYRWTGKTPGSWRKYNGVH